MAPETARPLRERVNGVSVATVVRPPRPSFIHPPALPSAQTEFCLLADRINNRIRKIDAAGQITTIAGTGTYGFSGDGGPATAAQLAYPTDVYLTATGELLFADSGNRRVRKIATNGIITTIAGNGTAGFGGDGGLATNASFQSPNGLALDTDGNLYIADSFNNRIRKIDTNGIITTMAGNGAFGNSGDGGPATQAAIGLPSYLTFDASGALYVTQTSGWIRRIDANGTISTVAGTARVILVVMVARPPRLALNNPAGIRFNAAGNYLHSR